MITDLYLDSVNTSTITKGNKMGTSLYGIVNSTDCAEESTCTEGFEFKLKEAGYSECIDAYWNLTTTSRKSLFNLLRLIDFIEFKEIDGTLTLSPEEVKKAYSYLLDELGNMNKSGFNLTNPLTQQLIEDVSGLNPLGYFVIRNAGFWVSQ